jgi:hypothetical protein
VTKAIDESLRHKAADFRQLTKCRGSMHVTIVTTYDLKQNAYSGMITVPLTPLGKCSFGETIHRKVILLIMLLWTSAKKGGKCS